MAKKDLVPRLLSAAGALFLVFVLGFATAHLGWPTSGFLSRALDEARAVFTDRSVSMHHLHPARHDLVGVARHGTGGGTGVTLLTSYWPDHDWLPGIRLIDGEGQVLHTWITDASKIWPTSPYTDSVAGLLNTATNYVHGSYLFDNGDVLFNIEYAGLVRMNAAGDVLWRLDRRTHHAISRDDDGNFWVCAAIWREKVEDVYPRFAGIVPPATEDLVLKVSPEGAVLQELSILDLLFRSELKSTLWKRNRTASSDITHLNDVEPLSATMAAQYPMFAAGDLMVSLRYVDLVIVFDPRSMTIKWWADRPFVQQHDPDFIGDGWISIYDNNNDGTPDGKFLGGSRLLAIRPETGEVRTIYPPANAAGERAFYTPTGGKAQLLPDGHWVLSEPEAGRVFEIDRAGRTVWEWGQARHADGATVSEVMEGTRYALTPEKIRSWRRE